MGNYATEYYAEDAVFPPAAKVIDTETYGPLGSDITATYKATATSDVRDGTLFGPASSLEGTLAVTGTTIAPTFKPVAF